MQTKFFSIFLLLGVALATHNASAAPSFDLSSILHKLGASVNLYKAFYEYVGAVLNQGIPALNVAPYDPAYLNTTVTFNAKSDPNNPNYTDINVWNNAGLNVTSFSIFEVPTADLDLDEMSAKLELDIDDVGIVFFDVNATALDLEGNVKRFHCNNVYAGVGGNNFTSNKQLEVVGQQLHVKTFELGYNWEGLGVLVFNADCEGDDEIVFPMIDTVLYALLDIVDNQIPKALKEYSAISTLILNDIFALRNVTDDDDGSTSLKPLNTLKTLPEYQANGAGEVAKKLSTTREDYLKSDKRRNRDDIVLKWTF